MIEKLRTEKETQEVERKLRLAQQLKLNQEKISTIEKEKEVSIHEKERIRQEIENLQAKKREEEIRLNEVQKFRKQEEKGLGIWKKK